MVSYKMGCYNLYNIILISVLALTARLVECQVSSGCDGECVFFYNCNTGNPDCRELNPVNPTSTDETSGAFQFDPKSIAGNNLDIEGGYEDGPIQDGAGPCGNNLMLCCARKDVCRGNPVQPPTTPTRPPPTGPTTKCGVRNLQGLDFVIKNQGNKAQFGEIPWMAEILATADDRVTTVYVCGGTLISESVVVTAAHCVDDYKFNTAGTGLRVRLGDWDTQQDIELREHVDINVREVIIHPEYWAPAYYNDIAILFLERPVKRQVHINTICIPQPNFDFSTHRNCIANGWGKDRFNDGTKQNTLKLIHMDIVPHSQCQRLLRTSRLGPKFILHKSVICAGGKTGTDDTCTGDGGGPLACEIDGVYYLAGITAWGIGCHDYPGGYVDVATFIQWIQSETSQRGG